MAAPSSSRASRPDARGAYGPTANGDYMEIPYAPSLEEFPDTIRRASSADANPNRYAPLPDGWKLTLPSDDKGGRHLSLTASEEDATSHRSAYDPPKLYLKTFSPFAFKP